MGVWRGVCRCVGALENMGLVYGRPKTCIGERRPLKSQSAVRGGVDVNSRACRVQCVCVCIHARTQTLSYAVRCCVCLKFGCKHTRTCAPSCRTHTHPFSDRLRPHRRRRCRCTFEEFVDYLHNQNSTTPPPLPRTSSRL